MQSHHVQKAIHKFLDIAIRVSQADMGNLQLFDRQTNSLYIEAQRGFDDDFLRSFGAVQRKDNCACGRALRTGTTTTIDDVERDPLFAPYREIAATARFRAVQSVPLVSSKGNLIGMISTHYQNPQDLSDPALRLNEYFALNVADVIEWFLSIVREPDRALHA